ncbi:hypothetical protein [Pontibacter litorisediminis]|uniref:hypothetical protein n=1 Tax=Pontibacter litorisediminis TaxID=1846260 RepID=UPI0023EC37E0|nr:hypothetical protein [Pontibacter litorisediminis]
MRKWIFILALLFSVSAHAQDLTYGFTGRFGIYETLVSSSEPVGQDDMLYKTGLQLEVGAWVRKPVTDAGYLQFTLLQVLERQGGGSVRLMDAQQNPVADAKTRYGSLGTAASLQYFFTLREKLALGGGVGAKYKYAAIMAIQQPAHAGSSTGVDDYYQNRYHRRLQVYVPLEAQMALLPRLEVVGQVQVPLTSKVADSSVFKELDLGVSVGVNYLLL